MINASDVQIDFNASGNNEILQNIQVILTTPAGTVPFDRDFGIDMSILDAPIGVAKAKLTVEYTKKIKKYEPRAKVEKVSFTGDAVSGVLIPQVVIGLVS
jgi:phage baseplate assembly protein W